MAAAGLLSLTSAAQTSDLLREREVDVGPPALRGTGRKRCEGSYRPREHLFFGRLVIKAEHEPSAGVVLLDDPVLRERDPD